MLWHFLYGLAGFIVVVLMLAFLARMLQKRSHRRYWETFASEHGLSFDPGKGVKYPSMQGIYRDRRVSVSVALPRVGGGGPFTRFGVDPAKALPDGLRITPQTFGARVKESAGSGGVKVGIPDVDKMVRIVCPDREAAVGLMQNVAARSAILKFVTSRFRSEVGTNAVSFCFEEFESEHVRLKMGLDAVVDAALEIESSLG